jgi:hypothetical protein
MSNSSLTEIDAGDIRITAIHTVSSDIWGSVSVFRAE